MCSVTISKREWTSRMSWDLTHLPLNKMAAILADDILKCIFLNENDRIPIQISLIFVLRSPIDNTAALVHVMAWRRIGDKPLPESMMIPFTDAYMQHWGNMSYFSEWHEILQWISWNLEAARCRFRFIWSPANWAGAPTAVLLKHPSNSERYGYSNHFDIPNLTA